MKIKEIKVFKSKGLVFAQFWSKFKNSTRALFQIFLQNQSNICRHIYEKKTWRAGRGSLKFSVLRNQVVLRKTLENKKFPRPALLCANISQIFFSHLDIQNICCCFFPRVCSTGPLALSHPSSSLSEFQLILVKIIVLLRWGFNSYQIFERKWNWQNIFTQIFLSEIISTTENGGQGNHFLISQILKG